MLWPRAAACPPVGKNFNSHPKAFRRLGHKSWAWPLFWISHLLIIALPSRVMSKQGFNYVDRNFNKSYSTGFKNPWLRNPIFGISDCIEKPPARPNSCSSSLVQQIRREQRSGCPWTEALSYCHPDDGEPTPASTDICIVTVALKHFPKKETKNKKRRQMCLQRWYSGETKQDHTVWFTGLNPNMTLRTVVFRINCRLSSSANLKLYLFNCCFYLTSSCTFLSF